MCILWNQALILPQDNSSCGTHVTGSNYASITESCSPINSITALQRPPSGPWAEVMQMAKLDPLVYRNLCYLQQTQLWWWITPQQNLDISVLLPDWTPLAIHLDGTRLWIRLALLSQAGGRNGSPDSFHSVLLWPLHLWGAALESVRWRKVFFIMIWTHTLRNERNKEHDGVKMCLHCDGQEADESLQKQDRDRCYNRGWWWDVSGAITTARLKTLK